MIKIGYVRRLEAAADQDAGLLEADGCQVVRIEPAESGGAVLSSILDFIGPDDQLVVRRLNRLADSGREILRIMDALETRGAHLRVLTPELDTLGASGRALRAALEAVAGLEPMAPPRGRRAAAIQEISALRSQGLGPVEIARRLGVSRMTIWRKLREIDAVDV